GHEFVDRWSGTNVTPLIVPAPSEGELTRSMGARRTTGKNMPVWREKTNSSAFLLRFGVPAATEVWSCELKQGGTLEKLNRLERGGRSAKASDRRLHIAESLSAQGA